MYFKIVNSEQLVQSSFPTRTKYFGRYHILKMLCYAWKEEVHESLKEFALHQNQLWMESNYEFLVGTKRLAI